MEPPTIYDLWKGFESVALDGTGCTPILRAEIKMAFFAGAGAVLATLKATAQDPSQAVDGAEMVDGWWEECDAFLSPSTMIQPAAPWERPH